MYYFQLSTLYLVYFSCMGVLISFWPIFFTEYLGVEAITIGLLSAIFNSIRLFSPVIWSAYSDKLNAPTKVLQIGAIGAMLAMLGVHYSDSIPWYIFIVMLFNFFWSAVLPQSEVISLNYFKGREDHYGRIRFWGSIGFALGAIGFGWMIKQGYLGYLFYTLNVLLFIFVIVSIVLNLKTPITPSTINANIPITKIRSYLKEKRVRSFLLVVTLHQMSFVPYYLFLTITLSNFGYQADFIGMLWALAVLSEIVVFICAPRIFKIFKKDPAKLLTLCLIATIVRWLLLCFYVDVLPILLIVQMLHALSFAGFHIATVEYVRRIFKQRDTAKGQALAGHVFRSAGDIIGGIYSGIIWMFFGQYLFLVAAMIAAITLLIFRYGKDTLR